MAIPGHEFVRAYFSNNDRTTVESFWTDGDVERVEYIEAKEGDPNWENLLTHIDIDALHEATYQHIKEQNAVFEESVIKLAKELSKTATGRTLYLLDEPTTGLHFHDVSLLLNVLHRLKSQGNTVVIIEHNLDVIKNSDWIIDIGPEGGKNGGKIIAEGPPEKIVLSGLKQIVVPFLKGLIVCFLVSNSPFDTPFSNLWLNSLPSL